MVTVAPHRHAERRGTAQEWADVNPVLADGERGYETDTDLYKMGNGASVWTNLPYMNRGPAGLVGPVGMVWQGVWNAGTAYVENDAVSASGSSWIAVAATTGSNPVSDGGAHWELLASKAGTPAAPDVQNFTTSGTWSKPVGAVSCMVEIISGGASGAVNGAAWAGGGGGYDRITVDASALGSTVSVTVGAGGAAVTGSSANVGGDSSFGAFTVPGGNKYDYGVGGGFDGSPQRGSAAIAAGALNGGGGGGSSGNAAGHSGYGGGGGGSKTANQGLGGASGAIGSLLGGDGGAGATGGTAGSGTIPGGGGGGTTSGTSGAGARGQVRVTTYFG